MQQDIPRGVRDFSPAEAISINYIIEVVEEVYKRFGFYPLITPAMEKKSVLNAKVYGDEPAKELFTIEGEENGLRYDFTVPLARYVASNKDLTLPFKRYQIGNIWRKEEPQKMRYRESIQADIDIVGSSGIESDAEIIAAIALSLEELGIRNYTVAINDRTLMHQILGYFKVPVEKQVPVMRLLDKIQKASREEILKLLNDSGINDKIGEELLNFVQQKKNNEEKLQELSANIEGTKEKADEMRELFTLLLDEYKLNGKIEVDFSLVRGLDYYTGLVFEFVVEENGKRLPTIGGGGRYDDLIGIFAKKKIPAVGCSIGINRLFDLLAPKNEEKTYAKVFIAYLGAQNRGYAINAANALRGNSIYVDLNPTTRNLSKQLEYADALRIRNVMIIGDKEREANKVKLRDMSTGGEELINLQEAIEKLKA